MTTTIVHTNDLTAGTGCAATGDSRLSDGETAYAASSTTGSAATRNVRRRTAISNPRLCCISSVAAAVVLQRFKTADVCLATVEIRLRRSAATPLALGPQWTRSDGPRGGIPSPLEHAVLDALSLDTADVRCALSTLSAERPPRAECT